jgi:hypothetical protein
LCGGFDDKAVFVCEARGGPRGAGVATCREVAAAVRRRGHCRFPAGEKPRAGFDENPLRIERRFDGPTRRKDVGGASLG